MKAQAKKVALVLPLDVIELIDKHSTSPRAKGQFVAECVRAAVTAKPPGILERIAEQMENRYRKGENDGRSN